MLIICCGYSCQPPSRQEAPHAAFPSLPRGGVPVLLPDPGLGIKGCASERRRIKLLLTPTSPGEIHNLNMHSKSVAPVIELCPEAAEISYQTNTLPMLDSDVLVSLARKDFFLQRPSYMQYIDPMPDKHPVRLAGDWVRAGGRVRLAGVIGLARKTVDVGGDSGVAGLVGAGEADRLGWDLAAGAGEADLGT